MKIKMLILGLLFLPLFAFAVGPETDCTWEDVDYQEYVHCTHFVDSLGTNPEYNGYLMHWDITYPDGTTYPVHDICLSSKTQIDFDRKAPHGRYTYVFNIAHKKPDGSLEYKVHASQSFLHDENRTPENPWGLATPSRFTVVIPSSIPVTCKTRSGQRIGNDLGIVITQQ